MNGEVTYHVNEESGTVVAIIKGCEYDAIDKINSITSHSLVTGDNRLLMPDTFKGVVKCSAEDTFDEMVGIDLAFEKAYAKYLKSFKRRLKLAIELLDTDKRMLAFEMNETKKFKDVQI